MGEIQWRSKRSMRKAYDTGEPIGMVSANAEGWLAVYRGGLIGQFPTVDAAVAAVEERHQGRDACE